MPENENIIYDTTVIKKKDSNICIFFLLLFSSFFYDLPDWVSELLDLLAWQSGKPYC